MTKPKLLVLTTTFPRWKNDTDPPFVFELSRRLTTDFEVTVHTPHYTGAKKRERLDNIEVVRFRYFFEPLEKLAGNVGIVPTLRNNRFYLLLVPFLVGAQLLSLIRLLLRFKPDVIHAHWILPQGLMSVIIKRLFNVPYLVTAHGADIYSMQRRVFQWLKCLVIKGADSVTAVSRALKLTICEVCDLQEEKIRILPMGISSEQFNPSRRDLQLRERFGLSGPLILYVGRLSEKKGVGYLLKAMKKVIIDFPMAKLLIIGSGEMRQELEDLCFSLEVNDNVYFLGGIPNEQTPVYYASCDVFVGPSIKDRGGDTEGFGLTLVEAAMSGCFLIGSDVGGISDIIENNQTGLLVPEKDSEAIAEKILYVLKNEEEARLITERARIKCIERFDWKYITQDYAKLLGQVIRRNKF